MHFSPSTDVLKRSLCSSLKAFFIWRQWNLFASVRNLFNINAGEDSDAPPLEPECQIKLSWPITIESYLTRNSLLILFEELWGHLHENGSRQRLLVLNVKVCLLRKGEPGPNILPLRRLSFGATSILFYLTK